MYSSETSGLAIWAAFPLAFSLVFSAEAATARCCCGCGAARNGERWKLGTAGEGRGEGAPFSPVGLACCYAQHGRSAPPLEETPRARPADF